MKLQIANRRFSYVRAHDAADAAIFRHQEGASQRSLFFRLGDFYELFFDDAVVAAGELQITLTSRNKEKGMSIPMCGVPYHAAEGYIAKLIRRGFKVAVCEQVEDARLAKTLVRREVTRVVTPGTAADSSLNAEENNFLAAVATVGNRVGFAALDLSTGEFRATEFAGELAGHVFKKNLNNCGQRKCCTGLLRRCLSGGMTERKTGELRSAAARGPSPHKQTSPHGGSAPRADLVLVGLRRLWTTGFSLPTTPFHFWRITLAYSRSKASAWQASQRRLPRPGRFCITSGRPSGARLIMWTALDSMSGRIVLSSIRLRCETWS